MGVPADQVAAEHQTAEFQFAELGRPGSGRHGGRMAGGAAVANPVAIAAPAEAKADSLTNSRRVIPCDTLNPSFSALEVVFRNPQAATWERGGGCAGRSHPPSAADECLFSL